MTRAKTLLLRSAALVSSFGLIGWYVVSEQKAPGPFATTAPATVPATQQAGGPTVTVADRERFRVLSWSPGQSFVISEGSVSSQPVSMMTLTSKSAAVHPPIEQLWALQRGARAASGGPPATIPSWVKGPVPTAPATSSPHVLRMPTAEDFVVRTDQFESMLKPLGRPPASPAIVPPATPADHGSPHPAR
ncbi:MAG TPA: hypothetical protein VF796_04970 [Humisphaera sp.]